MSKNTILNLNLIVYAKITSKLTIYLNIKLKIIKILTQEKVQDKNLGVEFLIMRSKNKKVSLILRFFILQSTCEKDIEKSYKLEEKICKPYIQQKTTTCDF